MTLWIMKSLHHWFGAVFAAFFFVIALSGVWVTVDKYIWQSVSKADYRQTARSFDKENEKLAITKTFETFSNTPIKKIEFPKRGLSVFTVDLMNGDVFYLNQNTFEKTHQEKPRYKTGIMIRVHKNLLNPWGLGHDIVVWTGLIAVFLAVLGVVVFIPQWRTFRKDRLFLPKKLTFRDTRRSHVSTGIIFSVFVMFFGFTGWAIGEPADATAILKSFDASSSELNLNGEIKIAATDTASMIDEAIDQLPDQSLTQVTLQRQDGYDLELRFIKPNRSLFYGQSVIRIDREARSIVAVLDERNGGIGSKISDNIFSLHTGDGRSLFYKLLLCIFGVIIGLISLTGLMSYVLKWKITIRKAFNDFRSAK